MTKESSERRVALLIALLGSVGIGFDKVIHVDTCKQLLESLSKEDMSTFVNHCYGMLLQPLEEKDGEDKELNEEEKQEKLADIANRRRFAALNNLYHLIMNYDQLDVSVFIRVLLVLCCMKKDEAKETKTEVDLAHEGVVESFALHCYPPISPAIQSKANELLSSLLSKKSANQEEAMAYVVLQEFENVLKEAKKNKKSAGKKEKKLNPGNGVQALLELPNLTECVLSPLAHTQGIQLRPDGGRHVPRARLSLRLSAVRRRAPQAQDPQGLSARCG